MRPARIILSEEITRQDLRYIDIQIEHLSDAELLGLSGSRYGDAKAVRTQLRQGALAYLNPHPQQTLLLTDDNHHLRLHPHPRIDRRRRPAENLLREIQRLRITTSAPNCPDNPTRKFQYTPYDERTYSPEPVVHLPEKPIWTISHFDELGDYDQHHQLPFRIEPSDAEVKEGMTKDLYCNTFRQYADENAKLTLFPEHIPTGEGSPKNHFGYQLFDGQTITLENPENKNKPAFKTKSIAYPALIILPALTTPVLHHGTEAEFASVILAVQDAFHEAVNKERTKGKDATADSIGPISLRRIHNQLRIQPIANVDKHKTQADQRLYDDLKTALENIHLHYLQALSGDKTTIKNSQGRIVGILDPDSIKAWQAANYKHLYQVDLYKLEKKSGLYSLVWFCPDSEFPQGEISGGYGNGCLNEPEDALQYQYLETPGAYYKTQSGDYDNRCRHAKDYTHWPKNGFARPGQRLYSPSEPPFGEPEGSWLKALHPLFISDKDRLNPGQLSDVHISSRQSLFAKSPAQVIPGSDIPAVGNLTHNNASSLQRLMKKIGSDKEVDLLLLTGDLYDFVINADPAYDEHKSIDTAGKLWEACKPEHHTDRKRYPSHIDAYYALSLIQDFIQTHKKPVLFVDGNHEAYDLPYGISPRGTKGSSFLHGMRANAGIPADHNLSIYEACLMYGPDYGDYHNVWNFEAPNVHWLRHLFSPWRDWVAAYGKQQTWIGVSWGEDESFIASGAAGGGALPRANEALSDAQWAMIQNAIDQRQAKQNLMLSHFTFVNYATNIPLNKREATVDANDVWLSPTGDFWQLADRSHQDEGSFHDNRETLYEKYLLPGKIHYTFSGHSHRAGVYILKGEPGFFTSKIKTKGSYPDKYDPNDGKRGNSACLIVTGSGGPLSWQNQEGEYGGYGIEAPQGIKLNATTNKISIVRDDKAVKPRMTVVQDFLWYEGKYKALTYPLVGDGETFKLRFDYSWSRFNENNHGHGPKLFDEIRLHLHSGGEIGYHGYVCLRQTGEFEFIDTIYRTGTGANSEEMLVKEEVAIYEVNDELVDVVMDWEGFLDEIEDISDCKKESIYFLSIHFGKVKDGLLHDHYCYESSWCFPAYVHLPSYGHSNVRIGRPLGKKGEVPDFEARILKSFGDVYGYGDEN